MRCLNESWDITSRTSISVYVQGSHCCMASFLVCSYILPKISGTVRHKNKFSCNDNKIFAVTDSVMMRLGWVRAVCNNLFCCAMIRSLQPYLYQDYKNKIFSSIFSILRKLDGISFCHSSYTVYLNIFAMHFSHHANFSPIALC